MYAHSPGSTKIVIPLPIAYKSMFKLVSLEKGRMRRKQVVRRKRGNKEERPDDLGWRRGGDTVDITT